MALTSGTITIKEVNQVMKGQFSVIWEFAGFDGETELPVQTFNEDYKDGDPASRVISGFQDQIKTYIDKYDTEQGLLLSQDMTDAVATVQSNINNYLT